MLNISKCKFSMLKQQPLFFIIIRYKTVLLNQYSITKVKRAFHFHLYKSIDILTILSLLLFYGIIIWNWYD